MSDELITWLRGVLDADEAEVKRLDAQDEPGDWPFYLADIAAKRAVMVAHERISMAWDPMAECDSYASRADGLEEAIRHLATAYSDRPGYREEWRP